MIKYADFQCSYCQKFALQTEPEIRRTYVDTGKVKYEYRNAAFLGDKSAYGAIGGYCANEQSSFWPYHDRLNAQASQLGQAAFSYDALTSMVQGLGLDSEAFYACLTSGKYDDVVSSETIAAKRAGYNSTPTFVVGTQKLDGALPFATFAALIDSQL
jgi:protein-disulfide isomerase